MADIVKWDPAEIERRESYFRAQAQPYSLKDPYTWNFPAKGFCVSAGAAVFGYHLTNIFSNKPWFFNIYPRVGAVLVGGLAGYFVGTMREKYNRNRDAYVNHYIKQHQDDFERLNDIHGRPYAAVLLPWYPKRNMYRKFEEN